MLALENTQINQRFVAGVVDVFRVCTVTSLKMVSDCRHPPDRLPISMLQLIVTTLTNNSCNNSHSTPHYLYASYVRVQNEHAHVVKYTFSSNTVTYTTATTTNAKYIFRIYVVYRDNTPFAYVFYYDIITI